MRQLPGRGRRSFGAALQALGQTTSGIADLLYKDQQRKNKRDQASKIKDALGAMVEYENVEGQVDRGDGIFELGTTRQATKDTKIFELMSETVDPDTGEIPAALATILKLQNKQKGMTDLDKLLFKNKLDLQKTFAVENFKDQRRAMRDRQEKEANLYQTMSKNYDGVADTAEDLGLVYDDLLREEKEAVGRIFSGLDSPDKYEITPESGGAWWNPFDSTAGSIRRR